MNSLRLRSGCRREPSTKYITRRHGLQLRGTLLDEAQKISILASYLDLLMACLRPGGHIIAEPCGCINLEPSYRSTSAGLHSLLI